MCVVTSKTWAEKSSLKIYCHVEHDDYNYSTKKLISIRRLEGHLMCLCHLTRLGLGGSDDELARASNDHPHSASVSSRTCSSTGQISTRNPNPPLCSHRLRSGAFQYRSSPLPHSLRLRNRRNVLFRSSCLLRRHRFGVQFRNLPTGLHHTSTDIHLCG